MGHGLSILPTKSQAQMNLGAPVLVRRPRNQSQTCDPGEYPSGTITNVLSVHCARRHLARLTGCERVLTVLKFEDEITFDDQDVSIEPVSVE